MNQNITENFETPIIFLIFKRPELTARVFAQIQAIKPKQLFVVADGPRNEKERSLCNQARVITENIDWNCQVYRNYSDENLGCRKRVSSGISWAFGHVPEAIILEDDCLPDLSFFQYCQTLLNFYKDDERVMVISGDNFQDGHWRGTGSYYFSKYNHCWGWATWRRAWQHWDFNPDKWLQFRDEGLMSSICHDPVERRYWTNIFNKLFFKSSPDSWAYAWAFSCWAQSGLTALPNVNLVSNIGFGTDATHTSERNQFSDMKVNPLREIRHPLFVVQHLEADSYTFKHHFKGGRSRRLSHLLSKAKQKIISS